MLSGRVRTINNGNEILSQQGKDENIELLKAQRQLYSDAKVLNYWHSAISLVLPIVVVIVQLWMGANWLIPTATYIVIELVIILVTCGLLFQKRIEKTEFAAKIQQNFDSRVFGVNFECSDASPTVIEKYAAKYDSKGKLIQPCLPWYASAIAGLPSNKAVGLCQKENLQWTRNLSNYCYWPVLAICLVIISFTVFLIAVMNVSPASICFLLCPTTWACREIYGFTRYKLALTGLESWESLDLESIRNVNEFQKKIFSYRKSSALIPDYMYEKRREVEETKADKVIKIGLRL